MNKIYLITTGHLNEFYEVLFSTTNKEKAEKFINAYNTNKDNFQEGELYLEEDEDYVPSPESLSYSIGFDENMNVNKVEREFSEFCGAAWYPEVNHSHSERQPARGYALVEASSEEEAIHFARKKVLEAKSNT